MSSRTQSIRGRRYRRHGAEVIADQLGDMLDRWPDAFDGEDRDMVAHLRHRLEQIATGEIDDE